MPKNQKIEIPLNVQLQAICLSDYSALFDLLCPYLPKIEAARPFFDDTVIKRVSQHFSFTKEELIGYLRDHTDVCEQLLKASYDKRCSPSTFIAETNQGKFQVGYVNIGPTHWITQVREFSNFAEAMADYVLFSWKLPRLSHNEADWIRKDEYGE
jgi:hypothetical protein